MEIGTVIVRKDTVTVRKNMKMMIGMKASRSITPTPESVITMNIHLRLHIRDGGMMINRIFEVVIFAVREIGPVNIKDIVAAKKATVAIDDHLMVIPLEMLDK